MRFAADIRSRDQRLLDRLLAAMNLRIYLSLTPSEQVDWPKVRAAQARLERERREDTHVETV